MSVPALITVLEHSQAKGAALLVLIRLADLVDDKKGVAWPGYAYLSKVTGYTRRHIIRCAKVLEASGELRITRRTGTSNDFSIQVTHPIQVTPPVQVTTNPPLTGHSPHPVQVTLSSYREEEDKNKKEHPASLRSAESAFSHNLTGQEADQGRKEPALHLTPETNADLPRHSNNGGPTPEKKKRVRGARTENYVVQFKELCARYPVGHVDEDFADRAARKLRPEEWPLILADVSARKESDKWKNGYVSNLSKYIGSGLWRQVWESPKKIRKVQL